MKTYKLHFRNRDDGTLNDILIEVESKSKKDAKITGKNLEGTDGKTWFMGIYENAEK